MSNKIIIFLIIPVLLLGAVGYWFHHSNVYTKEILRLEIVAPATVIVGQEIEYVVRIRNNSDIRLDEPRLIFDYPLTANPINGDALRVIKEGEDFGKAIYPGQEKVFRFRARIFGKEGGTKEARVSVSYRPRNLRARYVSRTSHLITIDKVPLTFEFDIPSSVGSDQEITFSLNYLSSVNYPLLDMEIRINYPAQFELKETTPEGISDREWRISLNKGEGGRIQIKGILRGETGTTGVFHGELGLWQRGEFVVLKRTARQVRIVEPSLHIIQMINGSINHVANPGDILHYEIIFRNVGRTPLRHLFLASKLSGQLFDLESIRSPEGRFQPGDNSIFWDWRDISALQFLDAGEEATLEFWISLKDNVENIGEPKLKNEIILGQARRRFVTRVNTVLEFTQNAYIDDEAFGSRGLLPPQVGEESLLTVVWKARSLHSPVQDTKVQAILPKNVSLTGRVLPQELVFDPITRKIVWLIGDLGGEEEGEEEREGEGEEGERVEKREGGERVSRLVFQIALRPTSEQRNEFAELIDEVIINGFDKWTEQQVEAVGLPITTEVFGEEDGRVK